MPPSACGPISLRFHSPDAARDNRRSRSMRAAPGAPVALGIGSTALGSAVPKVGGGEGRAAPRPRRSGYKERVGNEVPGECQGGEQERGGSRQPVGMAGEEAAAALSTG